MRHLFDRIKNKTEFLQLSAITNQGVISLIGLLRSIIFVRLLSPYDYGVIGIAAAVGSTFSIFQNLGLGVGVAKEAAQVREPHKLGLITVVVLGVRFAMLLPLLGLLLLLGAPQAVITYKLPQLQTLIWLYALFILVSSPGDILGYVLTGSGRFRPYFVLRLFNEVVWTIAGCLMIWKWGVTGYFTGQALAGGVYTLVSALVVWRVIGRRIEWATWTEVKVLLKSVFKTSMSVYIAKFSRGFSLQIPVLVAGVYMPMAAVGWLKFGMQAGGYFAVSLAAAQVVTLPRMTHVLNIYGEEYLFKHFGENFRRLTCAVGCLLIGAIMIAPELIRLIGGARYINSTIAFQFAVLFYMFIMMADNIFSGIHFPLNREGSYVVSYLIYFCLSVSASYWFIRWVKTPESVVYGLCIGAMTHYAIAVYQTRNYEKLLPLLRQSTWRILFILAIGVMCISTELLYQRLMIGIIAIILIVLDAVRNDPEVIGKIIQNISKIKQGT